MKLKYTISTLLALTIIAVSVFFVFRCDHAAPAASPQEVAVCDSISPDSTTPGGERKTAEVGATVKELSPDEYYKLLDNGCNRQLADDPEKIRRNPDSLTIFTRDSTITLLNLPYGDLASDFCIEWTYDGYDTARGLHFFSYSGYEAWGYYMMDDATGQISEYLANTTPAFCAESDLFATIYENPYEGEAFIYIYKLLPGGRVVRVASCNRDVTHTLTLDLQKPVWIAANSLVAQRMKPDSDTPAGFVRIDIDLSAPENRTPEPAPEWTYQMANDLVRRIKQRSTEY